MSSSSSVDSLPPPPSYSVLPPGVPSIHRTDSPDLAGRRGPKSSSSSELDKIVKVIGVKNIQSGNIPVKATNESKSKQLTLIHDSINLENFRKLSLEPSSKERERNARRTITTESFSRTKYGGIAINGQGNSAPNLTPLQRTGFNTLTRPPLPDRASKGFGPGYEKMDISPFEDLTRR